MYPQLSLPPTDQSIVYKIRQLIGDEPEPFVDDILNIDTCSRVTAGGTIYELEEAKGYPLKVLVNGVEYTQLNNPQVLGYKLLVFSGATLVDGANLTVVYNHFRHSDSDIIDTYDTSAYTYLVEACNLTPDEIGIDLLSLSTAYILLTNDLSVYVKSAVSLADSDSSFEAFRRPMHLVDLLKLISGQLKSALETKKRCKMMSLPVYKVE
jgi:hypothetical protein